MNRYQSPFHAFNLYRNPFGEFSQSERAALAVVDVNLWRNHLANAKSVLQFLAPSGHGKTTHLLAIRRELPEFQYVYLPEHGPRPAVPRQRPMMVDEAQRLSFFQLKRVLANGGPLVFGTHHDLSQAIVRAGLEPYTVDVQQTNSVDRLREALNRRIDASRHGDGAVPRISHEQAIGLWACYGPDMRAIEHYLFEQFQRHAVERLPWPPVIFPSESMKPNDHALVVNPLPEPS